MQREVSRFNPRTKRLLHILSYSGTFMMLFGTLFIIQMAIFGFIPAVAKLTIHDVPLTAVVFSITSLLIIIKMVKISTPYKKD